MRFVSDAVGRTERLTRGSDESDSTDGVVRENTQSTQVLPMVIRTRGVQTQVRFRSVSVPWILALGLTKAGDLVTTIFGLAVVDGLSERNPLAATVFERFGVVGLCWLTLLVICVVVLVVEYAASTIDRTDETGLSGDTAYALGYLPLVTLFGLVTVHNVVLLCVHTLT